MTEEMKKYHRDWWAKQSDERKTRKQKVQRERVQTNTLWVREYKTSIGCACGEKDWRCLDFHHLRDKFDNVSNLVGQAFGKERLLEEMQKCKILCANCHRKETFEK